MISSIFSRLVILAFGNLYPAYASYKAVRTKNVKEYVKWMMYWIVFALFTCAETFTDVFFSFWFPFYYEIKAILVIWLLSPATKGSSILYRRFVHPTLIRREAEIDEALTRATEQGYVAVLHLGSKGVNYATTVLMQTAIKGGGGLVQHLKKSYSLSDLTGEKEDENRNTSHMHDETDTEVEPRRREHVGRRGYSPRRTQSSSNRVEMYFSEVDVDVRQPRSREPTTSLTNIRSSDDISSGYSSGEALQTSRTSQGDSLVRTSSVGARTRAKPRSTTKKTPEDSGEDSDSNNPSSSKNISLPTPLSHVTPEQALEILLLLSQNSNISDYIKFDRGSFVAGNDDLLKNTSQSGSNLEKTEPEESNGKPSDSVLTAEVQIIQSIETKVAPERSSTVEQANTAGPANNVTEPQQPEVQTSESKETVSRDVKITEKITNDVVSSKESSKHASRTITDELCQNKFDELKQLLNNAHKAVNNIVYTQEIPRYSDASTSETSPQANSSQNTDVERADERENDQTGKYASEDVKILSEESQASKHTMADDAVANVVAENENATFMEIWSNPNESRNSNSLDRAGKYNKKPAPKVPFTKSEENLNEADAQSALKATLVIKTGTLKTFSNVNVTKDVFIAHPADAKVKGKKSKRQRTKQSFSKLLTIPKNIFHNAFYREHKGARKVEDSSSSDISTSETRSNSIEPQEMIIELAPKLSSSDQEINVSNDDKSENDTSNSSDSYVLALDDGEEGANKIKKVENEENVEIDKNEKVLQASEETRIRDMSQPLRAGQKLESDIF